jgi:hypothetical protein
MTIDEYGGCIVNTVFCKPADALGNCIDAGPCSAYISDPTGKVAPPVKVWVFTFGKDIFGNDILALTTDINIYDPDTVTLSDHLRTIDPSNNNQSCTQISGKAPCANRLIYYSLDDLGGQPFPTTTIARIDERADGTWTFNNPVTGNIYNGVLYVPVPATLPLFATGLGVLGLLGWRRKRKAAST